MHSFFLTFSHYYHLDQAHDVLSSQQQETIVSVTWIVLAPTTSVQFCKNVYVCAFKCFFDNRESLPSLWCNVFIWYCFGFGYIVTVFVLSDEGGNTPKAWLHLFKRMKWSVFIIIVFKINWICFKFALYLFRTGTVWVFVLYLFCFCFVFVLYLFCVCFVFAARAGRPHVHLQWLHWPLLKLKGCS